MYKKFMPIAFVSFLFVGCASVPMANKTVSDSVKQFNLPTQEKSGIYIYRDSLFGAALKKDIRVDGKCIGESAPKVFFFTEVEGGKEHTISTESEFSPNSISLFTKGGDNYFIRQYIKMGAFVGGANLEVVEPAEGKEAVKNLKMAEIGKCSE
ncbi:MAG: DUF2846 domain-containing protein [Bacteroidetes bacterium]|jgi:hypothetical protein|nr:DUF2846 domain-containing protein [Bacteroidota bacterium]